MSEAQESRRPPAFISSPPRRVLFVCVHNSARSQIAEGFARRVAPEGAMVWSAGTRPTRVHPMAIQVMSEIGIDISGQRSKTLDEIPWREADTVVTLCGEADAECPAVAGTVRRVGWPLPDPAQAPPEDQPRAFREIRGEIRWRLSALWPGRE
jgi:arsenate reductase